ncbi:MAG: zf-HC2 domain-containing protein [Deltaproteobacteria bacterium]|nr:zf-HC2 domain-containing protein [Deltaproteobacteria bacterium]
MDCQEYKEITSAHVDGALSSEEMAEVETHLERCLQCEQMFLWEAKMMELLKRRLPHVPVRPAFRERLLDQLGETSKDGFFDWSYMSHGLIAAFALLLIVTVPYLVWQEKVQDEIFSDAIAQYEKVTRGLVDTSQLVSTTPARLLDLSPWGYRLVARQTQKVKGREGRMFLYQGKGSEYLLAQEFDGGDFLPPSGAKIIWASNREFVSYSQEGVNLIAWKEKDLLCIIASSLPKEKLLTLAQQINMGS